MNMTITDPKMIRNVAIIAHVDHGKTTLVDGLLKQARVFRENQAEMSQSLIMDSGDLEKERGITILAKQTAIEYGDHKINIIDTPGHADFSGEVERTLNMADGVLLVVDAQEGPMPQTKFVLTKALEQGLTPVVVINKIDKRDARAEEVLEEVGNLFLELATDDAQLDFPVYYAVGRAGKAFTSPVSVTELEAADADLTPIFDAIIEHIPAPHVDPDGAFQMLVTALDYDSYNGRYIIGKISRGNVSQGEQLIVIDQKGEHLPVKVAKIFVYKGLERIEVGSAAAGDIVAITGVDVAQIGETIACQHEPEPLPVMEIKPPTLKISLSPNTSPFSGQEGKYTTSRQISERLKKELETNVGLRVEEHNTTFIVSGRGELHLSVLIESMRREGFEFEVGRPEVVLLEENGKTLEPVEELVIEVPADHAGAVTSELGRRRAVLLNMGSNGKGSTNLTFRVPTRTILGLRNVLLTATRGTLIMNSLLIGYEPLGAPLDKLRNGVLISAETGTAVTYGLKVVEERGTAFITPGTKVYEGMIIGLNRRHDDMEINACKEKKLTNVRASGSDDTVQLTPATILSLEEALDLLEGDELLEVTPESLRLRKRHLTQNERKKVRRQ